MSATLTKVTGTSVPKRKIVAAKVGGVCKKAGVKGTALSGVSVTCTKVAKKLRWQKTKTKPSDGLQPRSWVRAPLSPVPAVTLPHLIIEGDIPCGADAARAEFAAFYPALVAVMGKPYTWATGDITWRWDDRPDHGWDEATRVIHFSPNDRSGAYYRATQRGATMKELCREVFQGYTREVAHLFYNLGDVGVNFGPQWLRQALVGTALWLAGSEEPSSPGQIYDIVQNAGQEKVNGVYRNADKYGDQIGSHGRSWVDFSATYILVQVLSGDTGNDLIKRINSEIYDQWLSTATQKCNVQTRTCPNDFSPERFADILNKAAHGRTIDDLLPGDWLFAQPFTNANGARGRFLAIRPDGPEILVAAFERGEVSDPGFGVLPTETPLAGLDVDISIFDATGVLRGRITVPIEADGDTSVNSKDFGSDLLPGVYIVQAEATSDKRLTASNVFLHKLSAPPDEIWMVTLSEDGTSIRTDVARQVSIRSGKLSTAPARGIVAIRAQPAASVEVTAGSLRTVMSKPAQVRIVPIRVP